MGYMNVLCEQAHLERSPELLMEVVLGASLPHALKRFLNNFRRKKNITYNIVKGFKVI